MFPFLLNLSCNYSSTIFRMALAYDYTGDISYCQSSHPHQLNPEKQHIEGFTPMRQYTTVIITLHSFIPPPLLKNRDIFISCLLPLDVPGFFNPSGGLVFYFLGPGQFPNVNERNENR